VSHDQHRSTLRLPRAFVCAFALIVSTLTAQCFADGPYRVEVSSEAIADATSNQAYVLLLGATRENEQEFASIKKIVGRALDDQGYRRADETERAELHIYVTYGFRPSKNTCHLELDAYDAAVYRTTQKNKRVWYTRARTKNFACRSFDDVARAMPLLSAAIAPNVALHLNSPRDVAVPRAAK
jgi:hypothetical protein